MRQAGWHRRKRLYDPVPAVFVGTGFFALIVPDSDGACGHACMNAYTGIGRADGHEREGEAGSANVHQGLRERSGAIP